MDVYGGGKYSEGVDAGFAILNGIQEFIVKAEKDRNDAYRDAYNWNNQVDRDRRDFLASEDDGFDLPDVDDFC
jgi:hypothetical protein